ncbi:MAG TPA: phospholipase D-like domain-containing protein [Polyangiaceae bacterium]|nr:phospholipase D-like domain-containing protein [Polyangiaceae bacterium]
MRARASAVAPLAALSARRAAVELVSDRRHYEEIVVRAIGAARASVWIATANLKDVHIEAPIGTRARAQGRYYSIVERFVELGRQGVELRILHGALPSRRFRASLARAKELKAPRFELRHCPRVHLKMVAVDGAYLYLGSANFTGAGLGAKDDGRRNFELGVSTDDDVLLDATQQRFDRIFSGKECGACKLRSLCPKPLDLR